MQKIKSTIAAFCQNSQNLLTNLLTFLYLPDDLTYWFLGPKRV